MVPGGRNPFRAGGACCFAGSRTWPCRSDRKRGFEYYDRSRGRIARSILRISSSAGLCEVRRGGRGGGSIRRGGKTSRRKKAGAAGGDAQPRKPRAPKEKIQ